MKKTKGIGKKKLLSVLLVALLAIAFTPTGAFALSGEPEGVSSDSGMLEESGAIWDGTADTSWYNASQNSFTISTPEQLAGLAQIVNGNAIDIVKDNFAGKTVMLTNDIYLNTTTCSVRTSGQQYWCPIGYDQFNHGSQGNIWTRTFNGTFDGGGHIVYNIYIYGPDTPWANADDLPQYGGNQGLFGVLGEGAVIKNLGVTGYVQGRVIGGIAASTAISSSNRDDWAQIIGCFNAATIIGDGSGDRGAGGIFGGQDRNDNWMGKAHISDCYNIGNISCLSSANSQSVGGIAGVCKGLIKNCYSSGTIFVPATMTRPSAGIAGSIGRGSGNITTPPPYSNYGNLYGSIANCYGLSGASTVTYTGYDSNLNATNVTDCAFVSEAGLKALAPTLGAAFADDLALINNGFPILTWQVQAAPEDPVVISIYTQASASDAPVLAYEVKQSEVDAITQSDTTGMISSMNWATNNWNVTTAKDYISLADIFSLAGLDPEAADSIKAAAGDGFSATRTWGEMNNGYFYPNAALGDLFNTTGAIPIEPVLALTRGGASITTTAADAAQANLGVASASGCPRLLYGNLPENFNAEGAGAGLCAGNRFTSSVSSITLIKATPPVDPVVFTVYTQASASATPVLAYEVRQSEVDAILQTSPQSAMFWAHGGLNNWEIDTTTSYVTLSDIFALAGVAPASVDRIKVAAPDGFSSTRTWGEMLGGYFFPNAGPGDIYNTSGAIPVEPALALTYSGRVIETTAANTALANESTQSTSNCPRLVFGCLLENFNAAGNSAGLNAGNRYTSMASSITVINMVQPPTVGAPGSGDLDGDGIVTLAEAMIAAQAVIGGVTFTPEQLAALDMDGDGVLTMADVILIMRKAAIL